MKQKYQIKKDWKSIGLRGDESVQELLDKITKESKTEQEKLGVFTMIRTLLTHPPYNSYNPYKFSEFCFSLEKIDPGFTN